MLRTIKSSLDRSYKNKFGVIGVVVGRLSLSWVHVVVRNGSQVVESEGEFAVDDSCERLREALHEVYSYADSSRALVYFASDLKVSKCMTLSFDRLPKKKKDIPPYIKWIFQKQYLGESNTDQMNSESFVIGEPVSHIGKSYVSVAFLSDFERVIIASIKYSPYVQRISPLVMAVSMEVLCRVSGNTVITDRCFVLYVTETHWFYSVFFSGKCIYTRSQAWLSNTLDSVACHIEDIYSIQQEYDIGSAQMSYVSDVVTDSDIDNPKIRELFAPGNIFTRSAILSRFGASSSASAPPLLVALSALLEVDI